MYVDTEYSIWQRSRHSSQRTGNPFTGRRTAAYSFSIKIRKVCDTL